MEVDRLQQRLGRRRREAARHGRLQQYVRHEGHEGHWGEQHRHWGVAARDAQHPPACRCNRKASHASGQLTPSRLVPAHEAHAGKPGSYLLHAKRVQAASAVGRPGPYHSRRQHPRCVSQAIHGAGWHAGSACELAKGSRVRFDTSQGCCQGACSARRAMQQVLAGSRRELHVLRPATVLPVLPTANGDVRGPPPLTCRFVGTCTVSQAAGAGLRGGVAEPALLAASTASRQRCWEPQELLQDAQGRSGGPAASATSIAACRLSGEPT